jgi:adenylate kinase
LGYRSRSLVASCLTLLIGLAAVAAEPNDEEQLRKLNWDLQVATWKADAGWMKKNLAPEFILIDTRANIIHLDAWLKGLDQTRLEPFEPTEVAIRVYGNTGIVTARLLMKYNTATEHVESDLRYTDVWIKGPDGWKYVTAHASPIAVKREPLKKN